MNLHGFLPRWYCLLRYLRHERLTGEGVQAVSLLPLRLVAQAAGGGPYTLNHPLIHPRLGQPMGKDPASGSAGSSPASGASLREEEA